ncbi:NAD-dependent protein deacetylase sirtuin-7 [Lepeophtheirus salmonis]|uniref:NAD-dependent protein deacetylase sirtuin-7 n=1 Tax=Lepeophtheirus salmonis TaxID=72036 RepID=UPI001AE22D36|nr:NAD-dependent protein deacetylase sirtuin-7-like [Lepeophtheirus salmonis]
MNRKKKKCCSSSWEEEDEEDEVVEEPRSKLRTRKLDKMEEMLKKERVLLRKMSGIFKKAPEGRDASETALLQRHPQLLEVVSQRASKRETELIRRQEIADPLDMMEKKCIKLAEAIRKSKSLVVYTGAGISTAANIPDYRGPNGVWTRLEKGLDIGEYHLERSEPTLTHMALFSLFKRGKLKHIVSQNCDGLHLRSGIPRHSLSELHGNMFIEICKRCRPMRPFVRLFDVTERTSKNRHSTKRRCYVCGNSLVDTIVHFGERGSLKWPINWDGASKAADRADVILCLGSSLKVLRRYPWLWCMDKPKNERPKLFIVNLQWTPKDKHATLKLNGRCDEIMKRVFDHLKLDVPSYYSLNDPLLSFATRLNALELHTTSKTPLCDLPHIKEEKALQKIKEAIDFDHNYTSFEEFPRKRQSRVKSNIVIGQYKKSKPIDFKSISWPRDALYLTYENKFEFMENKDDKDELSFPCDCCDPAKKKRSNYESSTEDEEDESDETEGSSSKDGGSIKVEEDTDSKDSIDQKVPCVASSSKVSSNPGWFGKGRRKRIKVT